MGNENQNESPNRMDSMGIEGNSNVVNPPFAAAQSGAPEKKEGKILEMNVVGENPNSSPQISSSNIPIIQGDFQPKKNKIMTILKWTAIAAVPVFLIGGGIWGFSFYEKYFKKVAIEQILPSDSDFVMRITIDPNSSQFQLLEENMKKFPGYEIMKEKMEKEKGQKNMSESMQKKLNELNLDFEKDIKAILGERAYVIIPDIIPLGRGIGNNFVFYRGKIKESAIAAKDDYLKKYLALEPGLENNQMPKVLGEMKQAFRAIDDKKEEIKPLDFMVAAEVRDLKEAKRVMDKMKKNADYEIIQHEYNGYKFFEVKRKNSKVDESNELAKFFNAGSMYNAILGKNWVATNNQDIMLDLIDRKSRQNALKNIFSKKENKSLANDENFLRIFGKIGSQDDNLLMFYYNIETKKLFEKENKGCDKGGYCPKMSDSIIKYPDNLIAGYSVKLSKDGVSFKNISNQLDLGDIKNYSYADGFAGKIPEKIEGQWADVFAEYVNFKKLYYNFKRGNLTQEGLQEWNEGLDDISSGAGINIETDIIDQFVGNVSYVMFTFSGTEPKHVFLADIDNPGAMFDTMKKIIDYAKNQYYATYNYSLNYYKEIDCNNPDTKKYTAYYCTPEYKKKMEEQKKRAEEILNSAITETDTSEGKIYSYKFPGAEISFDYAILDKTFILGSHFAATQALMRELKNNSEPKLANNKFFQQVASHWDEEGIGRSFINTKGFWGAVSYYFNHYLKDEIDIERSDEFFAVGAVIRTIRLIGGQNSFGEKFMKGNLYLNIEELPAEEKNRAEEAIKNIEKGVTGSRAKANKAYIKSSMSSAMPSGIICRDDGGTILSGNSGEKMCSKGDYTWPAISACGPNSSDAKWTVFNGDNENWNFTLNCANFTFCNGPGNAICSSGGCKFGGECL